MGASQSKHNRAWDNVKPVKVVTRKGRMEREDTERPARVITTNRVVQWNPIPERSTVKWPSLKGSKVNKISVKPVDDPQVHANEEEEDTVDDTKSKRKFYLRKQTKREPSKKDREKQKSTDGKGHRFGLFSAGEEMPPEDNTGVDYHRPPVIPPLPPPKKVDSPRHFPQVSYNRREQDRQFPNQQQVADTRRQGADRSGVRTNDVLRQMRHFIRMNDHRVEDLMDDRDSSHPPQSNNRHDTIINVKRMKRPGAAKPGGKSTKLFTSCELSRHDSNPDPQIPDQQDRLINDLILEDISDED